MQRISVRGEAGVMSQCQDSIAQILMMGFFVIAMLNTGTPFGQQEAVNHRQLAWRSEPVDPNLCSFESQARFYGSR
jgi:hypothetical protein